MIVLRNALNVAGAYNSLSQSQQMDWGLHIVPVNGYRMKIYHILPADGNARGRGRGRLVVMVCLFGG